MSLLKYKRTFRYIKSTFFFHHDHSLVFQMLALKQEHDKRREKRTRRLLFMATIRRCVIISRPFETFECFLKSALQPPHKDSGFTCEACVALHSNAYKAVHENTFLKLVGTAHLGKIDDENESTVNFAYIKTDRGVRPTVVAWE